MLPMYLTEAQLNALPEGVREHYKKLTDGEKAGQYVLDSDAVGRLETIRGTADTNARRAAELQAQIDELNRLKAEIDGLGGLDGVKTLKQQAEEAERQRLMQDGNLATRVQELERLLAQEKEAVKAAKTEGKSALLRRDAERALDDGLAKLNVDPALRPVLRKSLMEELGIEAVEANGATSVQGRWDNLTRPIDDVLKGWSESDLGKKVILAPDTRGGADLGSPASPKPASTAGGPVTRVAASDQDAVAAHWESIVKGEATLA